MPPARARQTWRETPEEFARLGSMARIVGEEHCKPLADNRAIAAAGATHFVRIKMPDVGGVAARVRAVIACNAASIGAYVGGSCVDTDLSAAHHRGIWRFRHRRT
ncbi:hypothetical protein [Mesorhizobium sp. Cs1299R1N3]|uniref:hypothetical protein n=1 Tax=Mesorhizobium sp. Cs1299R1N3 TaxID=3015173 RepID=UPI003FA5A777